MSALTESGPLVKESYGRIISRTPELEDEGELVDLLLEEIRKIFASIGVELSSIIKREKSSIGMVKVSGRIDALIGFITLEFKKFRLLSTEQDYRLAKTQLLDQYLNTVPEERRKNHVGILLDGMTMATFTWDESLSSWNEERKLFDLHAYTQLLNLVGGSIKKLVSEESIVEDFSIDSDITGKCVSGFYSGIVTAIRENSEVRELYEEWRINFAHIYGGILDSDTIKQEFDKIARKLGRPAVDTNLFLFSLYTYYSIVVKLIGIEALSSHMGILGGSILRSLSQTKNLRRELSSLEDGSLLKARLRIENYVEGSYFSWYIYSWGEAERNAVMEVVRALQGYDLRSFEMEVRHSRDLLKVLYQEIIPSSVRHDFGEYYTPYWLIQLAFKQATDFGPDGVRMLDPGCGSGGFLVEAIRVKRERSLGGTNARNLLQSILNDVQGCDVNPVAVLTARTNYLLATADLLGDIDGPVMIPVFMCDSIITPTTLEVDDTLFHFPTSSKVIGIPVPLASRRDKLARLITLVQTHENVTDLERLLSIEGMTAEDQQLCRVLLDGISQHSRKNWAIWLRIIQNSLAPLFIGRFQYVIGNPPWIKWDFLSKEYKARLANLYLNVYKLFSHGGMKAGLGYSHDDISIVFTYVAADKYLEEQGSLIFVLKQTLYKSLAGKEFRKFLIERGNYRCPLKCVRVLDLLSTDPFKSSSSETSIAVLGKGKPTEYPVPYQVWRPRPYLPIREDDTLAVVEAKAIQEDKFAFPDPGKGDSLAPWIIVDEPRPFAKFTQVRNHYRARHGVVNDLNSVFFITINGRSRDLLSITNQHQLGRKKVQSLDCKIEPDLVYPVIKNSNVGKWGISGYRYMIVPQSSAGQNNEDYLKKEYPKTLEYLNQFKKALKSRSSRWFKGENKPFYSIFGIGDYTFSPYKVVWSCMSFQPSFCVVSKVRDEHLGAKTVIPDNVVGYIPVANHGEAHYICGILNSSVARGYFESRTSGSKWGISIEMIGDFPILKYDPNNPAHRKIRDISVDLHSRSGVGDTPLLQQLDEICEKVLRLGIPSIAVAVPAEKSFSIIPIVLPDIPFLGENPTNTVINVIDLETTGFSPKSERIVEVWIGKYSEGKLVDEFYGLVDPGKKIPKYVTAHHGISDGDVSGKPRFEDVAEDVVKFIRGEPCVFHNASFDAPFLRHGIVRSGLSTPKCPIIDTLLLSRRQFAFGHNDLHSITEKIGVTWKPTHRARDDGMATAELLYWMVGRFRREIPDANFAHIVRLQGQFLSLELAKLST